MIAFLVCFMASKNDIYTFVIIRKCSLIRRINVIKFILTETNKIWGNCCFLARSFTSFVSGASMKIIWYFCCLFLFFLLQIDCFCSIAVYVANVDILSCFPQFWRLHSRYRIFACPPPQLTPFPSFRFLPKQKKMLFSTTVWRGKGGMSVIELFAGFSLSNEYFNAISLKRNDGHKKF